MAPRYPFARQHPSQASSSSSQPQSRQNDRPIVVSASGVNPLSPGEGLQTGPQSNIRSRIPSPRNPVGFSNNTQHYPSPTTAAKSRLISLVGKKKGKGQGGKGWLRIDTESPTKDTHPSSSGSGSSRGPGPSPAHAGAGLQVPQFDSRGYPAKQQSRSPGGVSPGAYSGSSQSSQSHSDYFHGPNGIYLTASESRDSLLSGGSSTLAGHGDDRYRNGNGHGYPPAMGYSSDSPYDPTPRLKRDRSIAGSSFSVTSGGSFDSTSNLKQYDAVKDEYNGVLKSGRRHLSEMFHLPADPASWSYLGPEPDDDFHDPDYRGTRTSRFVNAVFTLRGIANVGCLIILFFLIVMLFAGYPILAFYLDPEPETGGGYNLGGINGSGQIPSIGLFSLIDKDTPQSAYTHTSLETGDTFELVFSDEFNVDGRTFYDGDDPYWEAVDLHYWQTNNLEWYDPRQITTKGGALVVTLDNIRNHGLNYMGGMMSTWNRFCFTGGYVEASVSLPGKSTVYGLWPAIWTMGNLGRAGYGGSLDGMWPYSYDSCDVGTLSNQTQNDAPAISTTSGDPAFGGALSYLPGQRLSQCTCPNDPTHPGPKDSNGQWKGRSAPEIDMFEATVNAETLIGEVSLSGQFAPFNPFYSFINNSNTYEIFDTNSVSINTYQGSVYQQATSCLGVTDQDCYTQEKGCFSVYGFEYLPGDTGHITWVSNDKPAWKIMGGAMAPNTAAGVGQRPISEEPMYLIVNLGISENFGAVDYAGLKSLWPVEMLVDYIRVYQDPNNKNIGCDPSDMPTSKYISLYPDAYSNPNVTTQQDIANFNKPKNRLIDTC